MIKIVSGRTVVRPPILLFIRVWGFYWYITVGGGLKVSSDLPTGATAAHYGSSASGGTKNIDDMSVTGEVIP